MKGRIKRLLGRSLFSSGLDSIFLRRAALVVCFHRVQARACDGLTVDVAMFERYCRFFKQHFRVVPLGTLVAKLEAGQSFDRELAITFDDGYRDNFEQAAPILERLALPAAFFVVTRWMGTSMVPWWDRRVGAEHPWMTWDEVRSLRRRGFEIGAHTRTHVDLGVTRGNDAREEIFGARRELEAELGAPAELFAYPYGGRENLAGENRDLVRAAGFRCCCSSFGGLVTPGSDPFHLTRVAVNGWYASPDQFGLEVALGRTELAPQG